MFALGALIGGGAGWFAGQAGTMRPAAQAAAEPRPAAKVAVQDVAQLTPCPGTANIKAASSEDGQLKLLDRLTGQRETDVHGLIILGKETAAGGRPRDAEVAFIMACRVATQLNMDLVSLADAKYQLARHYANVAEASSGDVRDDLLRRSRALYEDALGVYTARLGPGNEKTQFAANGLAGTRADERRSDTRVAGAGPLAAAAPVPRPAAPVALVPTGRPSFNCRKAHSRSEKMICGDPHLAQLDRELGQLYARAKSGTRNVADFQRRSDAEWRRRESSCSDRGCLLAWYAQRREQLLGEIESQHS